MAGTCSAKTRFALLPGHGQSGITPKRPNEPKTIDRLVGPQECRAPAPSFGFVPADAGLRAAIGAVSQVRITSWA
jgi:hypothetical protein